MQVLVTLNSGLGASTGPDFAITANTGSVSPSTANKIDLLAGKYFIVNDGATTLTVTSTGTCGSHLTINILVYK